MNGTLINAPVSVTNKTSVANISSTTVRASAPTKVVYSSTTVTKGASSRLTASGMHFSIATDLLSQKIAFCKN